MRECEMQETNDSSKSYFRKMTNIAVPRIWTQFEGKEKDGTTLKLRIQDVPKHKKEQAIDLFLNHFVFEEAISKACMLNYWDRDDIKSMIRAGWREKIDEYHMTICHSDDSDDPGGVMGVSVTELAKRDVDRNYNYDTDSEELKEIIKVILSIHWKYDAFEVFPDINTYLDDLGIVVHPDFRGLGIGSQFIKCRRLQCKDIGADMTGAWMSSWATQKAAENDGWETAAEFLYEDLAKEFGITFGDGLPPSAKIMVARP